MKKYYYKAVVDSMTGKALTAFVEHCQEAEKKAGEFVTLCGAKEYIESPLGMAGGVAVVIFPDGVTPDAEVWRSVEIPDIDNGYVPAVHDDFDPKSARQRDHDAEPLTMAESIELSRISLPIASMTELADILHADRDHKAVISNAPSFFRYKPAGSDTEHWYVCTTFACSADDMQPTDDKTFYRARLAALNTR